MLQIRRQRLGLADLEMGLICVRIPHSQGLFGDTPFGVEIYSSKEIFIQDNLKSDPALVHHAQKGRISGDPKVPCPNDIPRGFRAYIRRLLYRLR